MLDIVTPNGDDWISTLVLRDGRVISRRFSPGTMGEEDVLRHSLRWADVAPSQVVDATVRRAGDTAVAVPQDDAFDRLMRRIRTR